MAGLFFQEKGYQLVRQMFSTINRIYSDDYENVMHAGQAVLSRLKIPSLYSNYSQYLAGLNIKKEVFDYTFASPITFAAFESHMDSIRFWIALGCGGGCLKTIKQHPANGNNRPRVRQFKQNGQEHLINALGLPGPGISNFMKKLAEESLDYDMPIGLSVGGNSMDEYLAVISEAVPNIQHILRRPYIELNISCPNTSTGQVLHDSVSDIEQLLRQIRSYNHHIMVVIKVSPDAADDNLCDIADLATQFDRVTLNAGNTQFKKCVDLNLPENAISIGGGGMSGPDLFSRTLNMAKLLQQFKLPIIATGGVRSSDQIIELQKYGVEIVGMATQLVKNPFSVVKMNHELHNYYKND